MYKNLHLILQFSYLRGPSNHHCESLTVVKFEICALFYISFIRLEKKNPQNSSVILCHTSSRFQWLYGCTQISLGTTYRTLKRYKYVEMHFPHYKSKLSSQPETDWTALNVTKSC